MDPREIRDLIDEARSALESGDHPRALELTLRLVGECPQERQGPPAAGQSAAVRGRGRRGVGRSPAGSQNGARQRRSPDASRAGRLAQRAIDSGPGIAPAGDPPFRTPSGPVGRLRLVHGPGARPKLAEVAAREAIAANENSSTAWAALGRTQFRLHRYAEADASLQRALKLDPNDPYAQQAMMDLLHQRRQDGKAVALASLLQDTPGTEQIVEKIRSEVASRQIARKLLERRAMPEPNFDNPRHRWNWLFVAAFLMTGLLLLFQPATPTALAICVIVPMILLYPIRRLLG